jgi:hypothetical protein
MAKSRVLQVPVDQKTWDRIVGIAEFEDISLGQVSEKRRS